MKNNGHGSISPEELAGYMPEVAKILLGDPNRNLSSATEWRYGHHGSLKINLGDGTFYDHENTCGGGVLDLIAREEHCDRATAMHWLQERFRPEPKPSGKIVATYDYYGTDDELRFQVCRLDPKSFRQRRPDGAGGWVWKMTGVELVPYRLPQVVAAETVFVCEGEKDCDRLATLGLVATTNPGGVKKWRGSFAQHFVGKRVVILPDNDPPGLEHAQSVAKALSKSAAAVSVVKLPGLPPKGDVSDWLEGRTLADLMAAVEAAKPSDSSPDYILDAKGNVRDLLANAVTFLEQRPELRERFRFNSFSAMIEARDLPWDKTEWRPLEDHEHLCLATHAQLAEVPVRQGNCFDAMRVIAVRNQHHPVTAYLDGLTWDGVARLDDWLFSYMGVVEDNPDGEASDRDSYVRAVGPMSLIAAVARVYEPGCQADHMPVLEGPQGAGKSSAVAILGGTWFADQIADLSHKDSSQDLRGKWLIEMSELSAVRGKELERVKAYVSRRVDHYRASYGRTTGDYPRQCIFIGTTNENEYLQDHTGNRRFWPVECKSGIRLEELARDRDRLWAEAVVRYRAGEAWHINDAALKATAEFEQNQRVLGDSWEDVIAVHAVGKNEMSVGDIWSQALFGKIGDLTRASEIRIGIACKRLGFERVRGTDPQGKRPWIYRRAAK